MCLSLFQNCFALFNKACEYLLGNARTFLSLMSFGIWFRLKLNLRAIMFTPIIFKFASDETATHFTNSHLACTLNIQKWDGTQGGLEHVYFLKKNRNITHHVSSLEVFMPPQNNFADSMAIDNLFSITASNSTETLSALYRQALSEFDHMDGVLAVIPNSTSAKVKLCRPGFHDVETTIASLIDAGAYHETSMQLRPPVFKIYTWQPKL